MQRKRSEPTCGAPALSWMNARTELKLPADPVLWLNSALCGGNGKTSVQKYRVIEQMDCGRVGMDPG